VVSALAWWLIPLVATILAVAFVALRSRPGKPATPADGMERMQQAMERPMPSDGPATGSVRPFTPETPDPVRPQDGE
jgi:hypothetical protein